MARSLGYLLLICSILTSTLAFGKPPAKKVAKAAVVEETIPPNWQKVEGFDCRHARADHHFNPSAGHPGYHAYERGDEKVMCPFEGKCLRKMTKPPYRGSMNDHDCLTGEAYIAAVPEGYNSSSLDLSDAKWIQPELMDDGRWQIRGHGHESSSNPERNFLYDYVRLLALRYGHFKGEPGKWYMCIVQDCDKWITHRVPGFVGLCIDMTQCYSKAEEKVKDTVPLPVSSTRCTK